MHSDLVPGLLTVVLDGFNASDFTKNRIRDFVVEYKAEQRKKKLHG